MWRWGSDATGTPIASDPSTTLEGEQFLVCIKVTCCLPQQALRNRNGAKGVVAGTAAGVADDVRVSNVDA